MNRNESDIVGEQPCFRFATFQYPGAVYRNSALYPGWFIEFGVIIQGRFIEVRRYI